MENKTKIIIVSVALLVAFAFGRYSAPEHVKIETKIVEIEKKVIDTDTLRDRHREVVIKEIVKPDGTKEKVTTTVEDSNTSRKTRTEEETSRTENRSEEITRGSKVTLAALIGSPLRLNSSFEPIYGGIISKPILGPITVGVWGMSNNTAGFALGLTF